MYTFNNQMSGSKIFNKIDLHSAFMQIPMAKRDICKTAVQTPIGLLKFLFMPYGLRNASQTFQRYMDEIFKDCKQYGFPHWVNICSSSVRIRYSGVIFILSSLEFSIIYFFFCSALTYRFSLAIQQRPANRWSLGYRTTTGTQPTLRRHRYRFGTGYKNQPEQKAWFRNDHH